jgi:hypothetical protein
MSAEEIAAKKAEWVAKDDETCSSYGAKPGTDIYLQCRMTQQQNRDAADNAIAAAVAAPRPVVNASPASYPSMPTQCQTMRTGQTMQTVCN